VQRKKQFAGALLKNFMVIKSMWREKMKDGRIGLKCGTRRCSASAKNPRQKRRAPNLWGKKIEGEREL